METQTISERNVKTQVVLAYRKVIDVTSATPFEKNVFRDSYQEFRVQVQSFDPEGKFQTWEELRKQFPKANLNVNYKTGFAIGLYIRQLDNSIPGVFDNLGDALRFETHRFEILESDVVDRTKHKVALTFETAPLVLKAIVGEYLVLAAADSQDGNTITVKMQPGLSVVKFISLDSDNSPQQTDY